MGLETYPVYDRDFVVNHYRPNAIVLHGWKNDPMNHTITIQELRYLLDELTAKYPDETIIIL